MTPKESAQILAILKAAYPNSYKGMTKEEAMGTVNVWAVQFANVPADIVLIAVNKLIATSQFPPAPSEVHKMLRNIYWEAYDVLNCNRLDNHLTDEQVRYYEYLKEQTEHTRYVSSEPSIREIKSHYAEIESSDNPMLLGGG